MKNKYTKSLLCYLLSLTTATYLLAKESGADDYALQREQVKELASLTEAPKYQPANDFPLRGKSLPPNIRGIYYDALDWEGKPTKVFAILGFPKNVKGKVPAIVLVHGGGGKAFPEWVEKWTKKGYAAISIAVEGQMTSKTQHQWPGPRRDEIYADSYKPLKEQWMYHAVADTILANSLMRSLPEVDADKVGLMGISWGGVITSTVIGIDDRFAFAIPTYGCGDLAFSANQYGEALSENMTYQKVWDPMIRFKDAKMPTLWLSWPSDRHFPMNHFASSYQAVSGEYMVSLVPQLGHGHPPPWNRPESYAFADHVIKAGNPWCTQTSTSTQGDTFTVTFKSDQMIDEAALLWTKDLGIGRERSWESSKVDMQSDGESYTVTATLPKDTKAYFINLASGDLIASSDYHETVLSAKFQKK